MQLFNNARLGALACFFLMFVMPPAYSEAKSLTGRKDTQTNSILPSKLTLSGANSLLPSTLTLHFLMNNTSVTLLLSMQQNYSSAIMPVMIGVRGRMMNWTAPSEEMYATYVDGTDQTSIVAFMRTDANNSTTRTYFGSLSISGQRYILTPQSGNRMTSVPSDSSNMTIVTIEGLEYGVSLSKLNLSLPTIGESRMSTAGEKAGPVSLLESMMLAHDPVDTSRKQEYTVEVLLIADYSIYYKWYILSKATTDQDRKNDAILNIQYYFAHVINGVNSRYAGIAASDYSIRVKLVGYFIAMTPADSPWTEGQDVKVGSGFLVYQGLDKLQDWIKNMRAQLPMFDAAMLYSGSDLLVPDRNGNNVKISGLANIGAVCNDQSVSISLDAGEYASIETGAHELGHNLGAQHDGIADPNGVVANICNGKDFFIMSPSPGNLDNSNFNNPFTFSGCSIHYFRTYLASVTATTTNCLLTLNNPNGVDTTRFLNTYPGQRYNPDQQCRLLWGPSSFYCAGGSNDNLICEHLQCWDSTSSQCMNSLPSTQRAADGTTCASGSWCILGKCTASALAPLTKDTCISGDFRGQFNYLPSFTCETVRTSQPWRCYDANIMMDCCDTCAQIIQPTTGCEYGDKDPAYCSSTQFFAGQCYQDSVRSVCCATCAKFRTTNPTCLYGDHQPSCTTITSYECYGTSQLCCDSCTKFDTGVKGCEYGDKAPWCPSFVQGLAQCQEPELSTCCQSCAALKSRAAAIPRAPAAPACTDRASWCSSTIAGNPGYCYDPSTQVTCCDACRRFSTGRPSCQYGNKFTWCKREYCTQNAQECCAVCS